MDLVGAVQVQYVANNSSNFSRNFSLLPPTCALFLYLYVAEAVAVCERVKKKEPYCSYNLDPKTIYTYTSSISQKKQNNIPAAVTATAIVSQTFLLHFFFSGILCLPPSPSAAEAALPHQLS